MANKLSSNKRALRRCGACNAVGHNKATCTNNVAPVAPTPISEKPPLKFFVHHVTGPAINSAHVVDLKSSNNHWQQVTAEAPVESLTPEYHFHHERAPAPFNAVSKNQNLYSQPAPVKLSAPTKTAKKTSLQFSVPRQTFSQKISNFFKHATNNFIISISAVQDQRQISRLKKSLATKTKIPTPKPTTQPALKPIAVAPTTAPTLKLVTLTPPTGSRLAPYHLLGIKTAAAVLAVIAILTVPRAAVTYYEDIHSSVATITELGIEGFSALSESAHAVIQGDLTLAKTNNSAALQKLSDANALVNSDHPWLQTLASGLPIVGNRVESGQLLLLAGQELSLGNDNMLAGLQQMPPSSTLFERFNLLANTLKTTLPHLQQANTFLSGVSPESLPTSYQEKFLAAKHLLQAATSDAQQLVALQSTLKEIFGDNGRRKYLIVFQNENELRPTGGFMGSFAIAQVMDGKLLSIDVPPGGTYDLQGQLNTHVEPPIPLTLANKRWEFQDANWFPNFPDSAEKIMWFYRHSRGSSADGVIAINSAVFTRILGLVGSVELSNRDLTLTNDTALSNLQDIIENGPEKKLNKPKQVLTDTVPLVIDRLAQLNANQTLALLSSLSNALGQKEIQAYFTDPDAEATALRYGWGGAVLPTSLGQDYLMVVNANVQGGKSDLNIQQSVSHQAIIQEDGSIIDTVQITRTNTGEITGPLYGLTNIDYLRLYVPAGSTLLSASGFSWPDEKLFRVPDAWSTRDEMLSSIEDEKNIDERTGTRVTKEFGKYAFGNWVITAPGEESRIQFVYHLPFKAWQSSAAPNGQNNWINLSGLIPQTGRYQLVLQQQSGIQSAFNSQIILPNAWAPAWQDGPGVTLASNGAEFELMPPNRDTIWSLAFKTK